MENLRAKFQHTLDSRQPIELGKKHTSPGKPTKNNKPLGNTFAAKLTFSS